MDSMRERFTAVTSQLLDADPDVAVVLADIGVGGFVDGGATGRHPDRIVNVGIREQAMIGVAAGMALAGLRPIVHTYAPFLVERPYEQLKLDLSHHDLGAVLVSVGASYDAATSGRTHQAPEDVAIVTALPGWAIHVPGHPDEAEAVLRAAAGGSGRVYIRLSDESNTVAVPAAAEAGLVRIRSGSRTAPTVVAVGPALDPTLEATAGMDVTVVYTITPHPLDGAALRDLVTGDELIVIEPYLEGTSAAAVTAALGDRPIRLRSIGVANRELRRYGTPDDHRAAHGLDAAGIRRRLREFSPGLTRAEVGARYGCSARYRWIN